MAEEQSKQRRAQILVVKIGKIERTWTKRRFGFTSKVVPDSHADLLLIDVIELVMIAVPVEIKQPQSKNMAVIVSPLPARFQRKRAAKVNIFS